MSQQCKLTTKMPAENDSLDESLEMSLEMSWRLVLAGATPGPAGTQQERLPRFR